MSLSHAGLPVEPQRKSALKDEMVKSQKLMNCLLLKRSNAYVEMLKQMIRNKACTLSLQLQTPQCFSCECI